MTLYRYLALEDREPLRDVMFEVLPEYRPTWFLTMIDVVPVLVTFTAFVLVYKSNCDAFSKHILFVDGCLFFVNNICQTLTTLPDSTGGRCLEWGHSPTDEWRAMGAWVFFIPNMFASCADMVWSGHTAHLVEAVMIITFLCPQNVPARVACILAILFEAIGLLVARNHYSVDVTLGILIPVIALNDLSKRFRRHFKTLAGSDFNPMI